VHAAGGTCARGRSGGAKQNTSVLAIGRAPRPVPSTSRMTPPTPVPAPPNGSIADGRLCVSTLMHTESTSSNLMMPALSTNTLTQKSRSSVRVTWAIVDCSRFSITLPSKRTLPVSVLCLQCSDQVCARVSSSMRVGARPRRW